MAFPGERGRFTDPTTSPGCGSACIAAFNLPSTPRLQHASTDSTESAAQTKAAYTSYSPTVPLPYQRELATRLKKAGVRAIIGSHPHLFYEVESSPEFVCAYSLGNFVFDLCWDNRLLKSGILELNFSDDGLTGQLWPVEIIENGCLPTITAEPEPLASQTTLYQLKPGMALQQVKKTVYLFRNFFKGNSRLKLKFFTRKLFDQFGSKNFK